MTTIYLFVMFGLDYTKQGAGPVDYCTLIKEAQGL